jgi:hypothetical protein
MHKLVGDRGERLAFAGNPTDALFAEVRVKPETVAAALRTIPIRALGIAQRSSRFCRNICEIGTVTSVHVPSE